MKTAFKISIFTGLFILLTMVVLVLLDVDASNIVSVIPISILGASLFIGGIIGYYNSLHLDEKANKDK